MKQVTSKQIERLALRDRFLFDCETKFRASEWLKENASTIAAIEFGEYNKTLFGEWPKGWRAEMKAKAVELAKAAMIDRFRAENIFALDGAFWLKDLTLIEQLSTE